MSTKRKVDDETEAVKKAKATKEVDDGEEDLDEEEVEEEDVEEEEDDLGMFS